MEPYTVTYHFGRGIPKISETLGSHTERSSEERYEKVLTLATYRARVFSARKFTIKKGW